MVVFRGILCHPRTEVGKKGREREREREGEWRQHG